MGTVIDIRQILMDRICSEFEDEQALIEAGIEPVFEKCERTEIIPFAKASKSEWNENG